MKVLELLRKKLSLNLFWKSKKLSSNKYYTSVTDLPVWNWWQLFETKDLSNILLNKLDKICPKAEYYFELLQEDFIKHFGIDENYKKFIKAKCDIELMYIQQIMTGDKSNQLLIDVKELDLLANKQAPVKANYYSAIVAIEKFLGRKIEVKKETVYEFYSYLNEFKKWQKVAK